MGTFEMVSEVSLLGSDCLFVHIYFIKSMSSSGTSVKRHDIHPPWIDSSKSAQLCISLRVNRSYIGTLEVSKVDTVPSKRCSAVFLWAYCIASSRTVVQSVTFVPRADLFSDNNFKASLTHSTQFQPGTLPRFGLEVVNILKPGLELFTKRYNRDVAYLLLVRRGLERPTYMLVERSRGGCGFSFG